MSIVNLAKHTPQKTKEYPYMQIKVAIKPALATAFKQSCTSSGTSITSVLTGFISAFVNEPKHSATLADLSTRGKRRKSIKTVITQLEQILGAERGYQERIPGNLRSSVNYERSEELISILEVVIKNLNQAV